MHSLHYRAMHLNSLVLLLLPLVLASYSPISQWPIDLSLNHSKKVNVSLYVMSRCSDARICESLFDDVLKTSGILSKVKLNMNYIAHLNSSALLGLTCKHGDLECIGNAHQVCLHKYLPLEQFYANIACQNYGEFPGNIGTLNLTKQCADASKVDWEKSGAGRCIERKSENGLGKEAKRLLFENVERTRKSQIEKSCTIVIDSTIVKGGERRCRIDDGVWEGCDDGHTVSDFVRVIEKEWSNLQ